MQQAPAPQDPINRLPLRSLGLKPGMCVQTRRLAEGARKQESQFFGAIEGKGIMLGAVDSESEPSDLTAGDICLVRGFTGQYEFSFPSKVLQTFVQPFAYALLAYPPQVDATLVRQSMRVKRTWPTSVRLPQQGASTLLPVTLIDISVTGAMVRTDTALATVGSHLEVTLSVQVDNAPMTLLLNGRVCHSNRASYEDAYFMGLAFKGLSQQDKLVLSYLTQNP